MGDDAQLVPALWLLAVYRLGRSEHATVDRLVERLSSLAQKIGDPGLLCLADLQVSPLYQGRLTEAQQKLTHASLPRAMQISSVPWHINMGSVPPLSGWRILVTVYGYWELPEQATQRIQEACDLAAEINAPMTTCYAVSRKCWQHAFAGEIDAISSEADKLLQITRQHELRNFELASIFFIHSVDNQAGNSSIEEINKMYQAMEEYQSLGTV